MSKTKEELNKIKREYDVLTLKLKELNIDELKEVVGGQDINNWYGLDNKDLDDGLKLSD